MKNSLVELCERITTTACGREGKNVQGMNSEQVLRLPSIRFESVKTCLATAKSTRILLKDSTESTILLQGDAVTKSKVQKRQIVRLRICHLRYKCCIHFCTYIQCECPQSH